MEYFCDNQIVAIFLRTEPSDPKVEEYLNKYFDKVTDMANHITYEHLVNVRGMSEDQIEVEMKKLMEMGEETPQIFDAELSQKIATEVEKLNEAIYGYYDRVLTKEEKAKLNVYIDGLIEEAKENFEAQRAAALDELDKIEEEYTATGKISPPVEEEVESVDEEVEREVVEEMEHENIPVSISDSSSQNKYTYDPILETSENVQI